MGRVEYAILLKRTEWDEEEKKMKEIYPDNKKILVVLKIGFILGLLGLFYYSIVHHILLLIRFAQACIVVGGLLAGKEIVHLLRMKKTTGKDLLIEQGLKLFMYLVSVLLIFSYFGFLYYFVVK